MLKNTSLVLVLVGLMAGCSFIPDKFDNVEYMQLVNLNIVATEKTCTSVDVNAMKYYSRFLAKYSEGTLNSNTAEIYSIINKNVEELAAKENPSQAYCLAKKELIAQQTENAISTFGRRVK